MALEVGRSSRHPAVSLPGSTSYSNATPTPWKSRRSIIVDVASVRALRQRLEGRKLDTLFVNAGICKANDLTPIQVNDQDFIDMMLTNALSPMRVIEVFHDMVAESGVIAAMSSEIGSITNSIGFWELYSSSKAALNMLMKSFSAHHPQDSRALLLVAPGWVRTEMGGQEAASRYRIASPWWSTWWNAALERPASASSTGSVLYCPGEPAGSPDF